MRTDQETDRPTDRQTDRQDLPIKAPSRSLKTFIIKIYTMFGQLMLSLKRRKKLTIAKLVLFLLHFPDAFDPILMFR